VVKVPPGPVAPASRRLMRSGAGAPWSGLTAVSWPAYYKLMRIRLNVAERTAEGCIVFDAVVQSEIGQVKGVLVVVAADHVREVVRHEEAELGPTTFRAARECRTTDARASRSCTSRGSSARGL
jgi:hypothetical protein